MKLRYQTGIATLIQFVALTFLNVGTGLVSIFSGCRDGLGNCVVNSFTSVIFFLLITAWFGAIWVLGMLVQGTRSKRWAQLLIVAEVMIALVALFNARHHTDWLGLVTSLVDVGLAVWVIYLTSNILRSRGARITYQPTARKHVGDFDVSKESDGKERR